MNLNISNTSLKPQLLKIIGFIKKYSVFLFILFGLGVFGYLIIQIKTYANREPSESMIESKSSQNKSINIDKSAVKKVEELQETNVEVKALFEQARDNPFQE